VSINLSRFIDALAESFVRPARNRLESFIKSRSEWCISRQRVWGVPIPSLHHTPTDNAYLDARTLDHILSILDKRGVAYWWEGPIDDFLPPFLQEYDADLSNWRKSTDTMDVWFDSGSSWSILPERKSADPRADVCLEGSDQHRGWFQSQLLTAIGTRNAEGNAIAPYRALLTHGMVLDGAGKKMSKSLGNIMSPMIVVKGGVVGYCLLSPFRFSDDCPRTRNNPHMVLTRSVCGPRLWSTGVTCR
jgi:isoleucyl-tRNA synthetase